MAGKSPVQEREIVVRARDDYALGATHFSIPRDSGIDESGVILMNSATATPQSFYGEFARFFARQGFDVYTYDYRGIGRSAPESLKGFDASVVTWAQQDIAGVLDWVRGQHPERELIYFAHSVGGQLMGMLDNATLIDKAITVSSQSGYWRMQGGRQKYLVWLSMHVGFPLVTRAFGYFPWSRFAGGEDLPKAAALQWSAWCRSPNYLFDDPSIEHLDRYAALKIPILAYCIGDDEWGTRDAVHAMMGRYGGADLQYRYVEPQAFDVQSIGHFGFFKRGREQFWEDALTWIRNAESTGP